MRTLTETLKSLLVGGIVFLLPIGVILVVFGKLLAISTQVAAALKSTIFPGFESPALLLLLAVLILVLIALAAGLFARTAAGVALFGWLEGAVLSRLPIYTILKQMLADMSGGVDRLAGGEEETRVVAVHFDDQSQLGFVVDETEGGKVVIYLPGAPSALSGSVVVVEPGRVEETAIRPQQVMGGMRRLGAGLARLMEDARREGA